MRLLPAFDRYVLGPGTAATEILDRDRRAEVSRAAGWGIARRLRLAPNTADKPWRHHSWILPRDPDFAAKAGVALDPYGRRFAGSVLRPDEFVISADEKTSIQARCRCHPTLPPGVARAMRVEHEYQRGGALAYLAAWTSTRHGCLAAARPPPASSRSGGWWSRS